MATDAEIASLRLQIAEPDDSVYSDVDLSARIDASDSATRVAAEIWTEKASRYAGLVNISEAGSTRANSDLHKNALTMAARFHSLIPAVAPDEQVGARISRLRRG